MEINPKLVKGLSGAELHVSAIYLRDIDKKQTTTSGGRFFC